MDLTTMTARALDGEGATREEALAILRTADDEIFTLVAAAGRVRRKFFANRVKLNYLVSLKSGMCPEDCSYCSQALTADTDVLQYSWLEQKAAYAAAKSGVEGGASRVCLVASGHGPSNRDVEKVAGVVETIKEDFPDVEVCACLGFLRDGQAARLREAGVDRYNHNLNTAESMYEDICSTHTYAEREETLRRATIEGLSACSGLIAGMGETDEQLVDVVFALRDLDSDSIPVNFLLPFEGTPLEGHKDLTPQQCLRILCMVRFVNPKTEVRCAAGREYHLKSLQPLALEVANSIFLGDYLTSEGQAGQKDLEMIRELGMVPESDRGECDHSCGNCDDCEKSTPAPAASGCCGGQGGCGEPAVETSADAQAPTPELRRRGAGTAEPANA